MKIKFIIPQITRAVKENVERCGWGNRVRQGTVGLSEELATQCATVCVDAFNMGNKSQYELSVQKYMQDGLTRAEAQEKATQDLIAETLLSAAGGFATNSISGAVIDLGKRKKGSGETASLLQSALELPSDSPAHKLAAELSDKLETALTEQGIDAADLYQMSRTEQDALIERTMDAAISDQELGQLQQLVGSADSRDRLGAIDTRATAKLKQGICAFSQDDVLYQNVQKVQPDGNKFDVAMHGSPTTVAFGGKEANMSPRLLASIIRHSEGYNGEDIRLLSCSTGVQENGGYSFAEELANALGVCVYAPNDLLIIHNDGTIKIGRYNQGEFVCYKPNQRGRYR